jgi:hypothetical protein
MNLKKMADPSQFLIIEGGCASAGAITCKVVTELSGSFRVGIVDGQLTTQVILKEWLYGQEKLLFSTCQRQGLKW